MADIDNLRKQAKRLLRWRRERHWPVAAAIREALPRFAGMSDAEVFAAPFALADAQEAIARQNGFDSWPALISNGATMTAAATPKPAADISFTGAEPCLFVADFARARDFYVTTLGFKLEFAYGAPPYYGLVSRGAARLTLRLVKEPVFTGDIREREQLLAASLTLGAAADIKALYDGWAKAGVPMFQPLRTEPWGARTFILRDSDGNLVLVASPGG
jgi:uncharacterized glyoxalase superfamily protein PhnB